jgi:tellurite resistance protein TerC
MQVEPTPSWAWIVFSVVLSTALFIDLFLHRGGREEPHRRAVVWAIVWISLGLSFCAFIALALSPEKAADYLAAYLIEESLSVDNLFVFVLIFQSLKIGPEHQRTVLTWGIFGALVFRLIFIFLGTEAIERWNWVAYVFGAILIWAAIKIFREDPAGKKENKVVSWLSKHLPLTPELEGHRFFVVKNGRRMGTPLLLAVVGLETTDIMFAIDSVPAAFSVSTEKFIVYSSNAFAILGLRSLYIVLAKSISELEYLHYGLAAVLAFAGLKLILAEWRHIPAALSIGIIVLCIGGSVWASLRARKRRVREGAAAREKSKGVARKRPAGG